MVSSIGLNAVRNGVRDAIATKAINDIFSPAREGIANDMEAAIQAKAEDRIQVVEVFLRDVQAPPTVREGIDEKLLREQQKQLYRQQKETKRQLQLQERAAHRQQEAASRLPPRAQATAGPPDTTKSLDKMSVLGAAG